MNSQGRRDRHFSDAFRQTAITALSVLATVATTYADLYKDTL
jgi:hypothetical protein